MRTLTVLLLLAAPLEAQTASTLPLQGYADSVLRITNLAYRQQRRLDNLTTGAEAREMVERLAALAPPPEFAERHAALVERATSWARSVPKATQPPRTGQAACLGSSASSDAECRSGTAPAFSDRQDFAERYDRFRYVRRELLKALQRAGAVVPPHAA